MYHTESALLSDSFLNLFSVALVQQYYSLWFATMKLWSGKSLSWTNNLTLQMQLDYLKHHMFTSWCWNSVSLQIYRMLSCTIEEQLNLQNFFQSHGLFWCGHFYSSGCFYWIAVFNFSKSVFYQFFLCQRKIL